MSAKTPSTRRSEPFWLQGRRFPENTAVPKYCNLAGVPVPALFNVDRLRGLDPKTEVFLCEGAPDTTTLDQAGFRLWESWEARESSRSGWHR